MTLSQTLYNAFRNRHDDPSSLNVWPNLPASEHAIWNAVAIVASHTVIDQVAAAVESGGTEDDSKAARSIRVLKDIL